MIYTLFDLEADGLLYPEGDSPVATRIHCLCARTIDTTTKTRTHHVLTDPFQMADFICSDATGILVGHNIIRYDIPLLEKLLAINLRSKPACDTLALSWYLYPNRSRQAHNLEDWGEDLGIAKVQIDDWSVNNLEMIVMRCKIDVNITERLFDKELDYLKRIYMGQSIMEIIEYLSFKMDCAAEQEQVRWKADRSMAEANKIILEGEEAIREEALCSVMPLVQLYRKMDRPKKPHKKDGSLSAVGERWVEAMAVAGVEDDEGLESIRIPNGTEPGKPTNAQIKKWLFSMGWEPDVFKYEKEENPDGSWSERPIPQISKIDGTGLTDSVKALIEDHPEVEHLDGLFTIRSRKNNVKGMLKHMTPDNYLTASVHGFTNTLRFQHANPLVNLPSVAKRYGQYVRSILMAPEGYTLCGSDMKSLEDSTKRHYMWNYDPEYVTEMMAPDFDPHIDIGLQANLITPEDAEFYKWYESQPHDHQFTPEQKERKKIIGDKRKSSKQVNFASVYGAKPKKLSLSSGMSIQLANTVYDAYWRRNWSVKQIAEDIFYKTVDGQMWMFNPVSKFWYSLRYVKDIFSTLNQGTGVFCFDMQVRNVRKRGIKICGQFHDEWAAAVRLGTEPEVQRICASAIAETNETLKLNITLGISVQFGPRYSDIH
jgi:hypothetical protein